MPPGSRRYARQTQRGHEAGHDDESRCCDELPAAGPSGAPRFDDVGHPLGGATQDRVGGGHEGRHGRRLDPVEEGRRVPTEKQQRNCPPDTGQRDSQGPPSQETPACSPAQRDQDPQQTERKHRDSGDRIDAACHEDGDAAQRSTATCREGALGNHDQGDEDPGGHRERQHLAREHPEFGDHARRQGIGQARDDARGVAGDAEESRQAHHAQECRDEDEGPPQALHDPGRQSGEVPQDEEGSGREEVAVGLVLQLAEESQRLPQCERPAEEFPRVDGEVEFGIRGDATWILDERHRGERDTHRDEAQAVQEPSVGVACADISTLLQGGRHAGLRRRTSMRFQVITSRSAGTLTTQCSRRGRYRGSMAMTSTSERARAQSMPAAAVTAYRLSP